MMLPTYNIDSILQMKVSKKCSNRHLMWKSHICGFLRACFVNNIQTFCVFWKNWFLIHLRHFMDDLNSENQILHHLRTCLETSNRWGRIFYIIFLMLCFPSRKNARKSVTTVSLSTHYRGWVQGTYFNN